MAEANEIVTSFSVVLKDQALTVLTNLYTAFDKINDKASEFGKFVTGQADVTELFRNFLTGSNDIMQLSRATGYSAETLQKWSYAAKAAGVSAESVLGDMKNLQNHYITSEKGLLNLARSFQKMSPIIRQQYGSWYGMSQDTINLLSQGPEAVKKWLDEAEKMGAVIPKEDLEKAAEAHKKWETTLESFRKTAEKTLTPFVEGMTKALEKVNEFMKNNPEKVLNGINTALKFMIGMKVTRWVVSAGKEFLTFTRTIGDTQAAVGKLSNAYLQSLRSMSRQGGTIGAIGNGLRKLRLLCFDLTKAINGVAMAFAASEIIDMLTGGKYSDAMGNFWGDFFSDPSRTINDRMYKGINWLGEKTGWWEQKENPYDFGKVRKVEPTVRPLPVENSNANNNPSTEQILQKMSYMNEPTSQMTKGGNIFYIYNMGGTGVDQQLESLFNA